MHKSIHHGRKRKRLRTNLLNITLLLVLKDPRPLEELAKFLKVSLPWLKKLRAGAIKSPSVNRIQSIYETLSGKALLK